MLSHRAMYYGMTKAFPGVNVVSEEHDPAPFDRDACDYIHEMLTNSYSGPRTLLYLFCLDSSLASGVNVARIEQKHHKSGEVL